MDAATAALVGALGAGALAIGGNVWVQRRQLAADAAHLNAQIAADVRKRRREAERKILDEGATIITRFRIAMGSVQRPEARRWWRSRGGQDAIEVPRDWDGAVGAVTVFQARLRLWFDDQSEVVAAFDEMLGLIRFAADLRLGRETPIAGLSVDGAVDGLFTQLNAAQGRYLAAARELLVRGEVPPLPPPSRPAKPRQRVSEPAVPRFLRDFRAVSRARRNGELGQ
jgi:hypothetical protein